LKRKAAGALLEKRTGEMQSACGSGEGAARTGVEPEERKSIGGLFFVARPVLYVLNLGTTKADKLDTRWAAQIERAAGRPNAAVGRFAAAGAELWR